MIVQLPNVMLGHFLPWLQWIGDGEDADRKCEDRERDFFRAAVTVHNLNHFAIIAIWVKCRTATFNQ